MNTDPKYSLGLSMLVIYFIMPHVAIPIDRSKSLVAFNQLLTLAKEFRLDHETTFDFGRTSG
jgi:hypothetical protein